MSFWKKKFLGLGCGVLIEKNWVGVGVVVSYCKKVGLIDVVVGACD